eukprot:366199-Chlamydomonas_euryale.AAC.19
MHARLETGQALHVHACASSHAAKPALQRQSHMRLPLHSFPAPAPPSACPQLFSNLHLVKPLVTRRCASYIPCVHAGVSSKTRPEDRPEKMWLMPRPALHAGSPTYASSTTMPPSADAPGAASSHTVKRPRLWLWLRETICVPAGPAARNALPGRSNAAAFASWYTKKRPHLRVCPGLGAETADVHTDAAKRGASTADACSVRVEAPTAAPTAHGAAMPAAAGATAAEMAAAHVRDALPPPTLTGALQTLSLSLAHAASLQLPTSVRAGGALWLGAAGMTAL